MSVDGTHFRVPQFKPFSKAWYSFKFKGPGVAYEVAVCILTGWIVWVNGPFPCGDWPDIEIFRASLLSMLGHGERVEADDGYSGESPLYCRLPGSQPTDPYFEGLRQRVRNRQETVNSRFKDWKCLKEAFHHAHDFAQKHSDCFHAVAVITQLEIQTGHPLFETQNYDDSSAQMMQMTREQN